MCRKLARFSLTRTCGHAGLMCPSCPPFLFLPCQPCLFPCQPGGLLQHILGPNKSKKLEQAMMVPSLHWASHVKLPFQRSGLHPLGRALLISTRIKSPSVVTLSLPLSPPPLLQCTSHPDRFDPNDGCPVSSCWPR